MRSASRRRSDEPARPSNVQFQARGSTPSRRTGPAEVATEGRPDLDELIVDAAVRALGANRKDSDTRGSRPRKGRIPDGRQSLEVESHENLAIRPSARPGPAGGRSGNREPFEREIRDADREFAELNRKATRKRLVASEPHRAAAARMGAPRYAR
jgi:hypothetical protein